MGKNTWMVKAFFKMKFPVKVKFVKGFLGEKKYLTVPGKRLPAVDMKQLLKCALCPTMCRFECPSLRVTKKEMYAPAAKSRISYHMERGNLDMHDLHSAEVPYMCTNCDGCRHWCPMDISTGQLLKGVRADLVTAGCVSDTLKDFDARVRENSTMFSKATFTAHPEFDVRIDKPEIFYYMGCVMAEKKPEAVAANIEILKKAGIRFSTFSTERTCCGGPSNTVGFQQTTKDFAAKNLALFAKSGAHVIVADCPACVDTIANTYKALGIKHDYLVMTTVEYYRMLVEQGKLDLSKAVDVSITYHDPCIAARGIGDVENARFLFNKIPGLQVREPFLHGLETQCCGMGGVSHVHHPRESEAIGKQRYDQLEKTGADSIVTSCPACEEGFLIACHEQTGKVLDIAEIIERAMN